MNYYTWNQIMNFISRVFLVFICYREEFESDIHSGSRQVSGLVALIALTNVAPSGNSVAFKFKTNAPERISVRPVFGSVQSSHKQMIFSIMSCLTGFNDCL